MKDRVVFTIGVSVNIKVDPIASQDMVKFKDRVLAETREILDAIMPFKEDVGEPVRKVAGVT